MKNVKMNLKDSIPNYLSEKSLSRLLPLKEKILKTDWLIDQIVYRLYGLTEDEIKLVENVG